MILRGIFIRLDGISSTVRLKKNFLMLEPPPIITTNIELFLEVKWNLMGKLEGSSRLFLLLYDFTIFLSLLFFPRIQTVCIILYMMLLFIYEKGSVLTRFDEKQHFIFNFIFTLNFRVWREPNIEQYSSCAESLILCSLFEDDGDVVSCCGYCVQYIYISSAAVECEHAQVSPEAFELKILSV